MPEIDFGEELASPRPTVLLSKNPLTAILLNAVRQSALNAAQINQGEFKGGQTGMVAKRLLKDTAGGLPSAFRNAMIQVASENAAIPVGKREITFAPSERGVETNLSNVFGGNATLSLDPNFLGVKFARRF